MVGGCCSNKTNIANLQHSKLHSRMYCFNYLELLYYKANITSLKSQHHSQEQLWKIASKSFIKNKKKLWIRLKIDNKIIHFQIQLQWSENLANTCMWHTEPLDSCFDLIRSHQQCIPWSLSLEIEPATTECRAKTLPLSHLFTLHTNIAKLTSHKKIYIHLIHLQSNFSNQFYFLKSILISYF